MAAKAPRLIFNDYLDAGLTLLFVSVSWILVFETIRACRTHWLGGTGSPKAGSKGHHCPECVG
jgi:carbon starvation protein